MESIVKAILFLEKHHPDSEEAKEIVKELREYERASQLNISEIFGATLDFMDKIFEEAPDTDFGIKMVRKGCGKKIKR